MQSWCKIKRQWHGNGIPCSSNPRSSLHTDFWLHTLDQTKIPLESTCLFYSLRFDKTMFTSWTALTLSFKADGEKVPRPLGHQLEVQARSAACPGRCWPIVSQKNLYRPHPTSVDQGAKTIQEQSSSEMNSSRDHQGLACSIQIEPPQMPGTRRLQVIATSMCWEARVAGWWMSGVRSQKYWKHKLTNPAYNPNSKVSRFIRLTPSWYWQAGQLGQINMFP